MTGTVPFTTLSPNPTTTSATITGLTVDTTYQVRVAAYNGVNIINASNRLNSTSPLKKWNLFGNQATTENWQADFVAIFIFEKVLTPGQRQLFFDYIETNYAVVMP